MSKNWFKRISNRGPLYLLPVLLLGGLMRWLHRRLITLKWAMLGISIGRECHIGPYIRAADPSKVSLGDHVVVGEGVQFASETNSGKLIVGNRVEIGRRSVIDHAADLTLEEGVLLSENVILYTHDHGYDPRSTPTASPLVLKKGCWIGARAIVLPCVNYIGTGAIVGAGCVVSEDVPDWHVYVGGKGRLIPRKDRQAITNSESAEPN